MNFFSKQEMKAISVILMIIFTLSFFNFRLALRRSRDAQRRSDLGAISNALDKYHLDFGFFPPATIDGKILACPGDNFEKIAKEAITDVGFDLEKYFEALRPCDWGVDGLLDLEDENYPAYIKTFPQDPRTDEGINYFYYSNTKRFQIYSYLEGEEDEVGFDEQIIKRNLSCGKQTCNFGKSFGETPLDKSIEEYENELLEKTKNLK